MDRDRISKLLGPLREGLPILSDLPVASVMAMGPMPGKRSEKSFALVDCSLPRSDMAENGSDFDIPGSGRPERITVLGREEIATALSVTPQSSDDFGLHSLYGELAADDGLADELIRVMRRHVLDQSAAAVCIRAASRYVLNAVGGVMEPGEAQAAGSYLALGAFINDQNRLPSRAELVNSRNTCALPDVKEGTEHSVLVQIHLYWRPGQLRPNEQQLVPWAGLRFGGGVKESVSQRHFGISWQEGRRIQAEPFVSDVKALELDVSKALSQFRPSLLPPPPSLAKRAAPRAIVADGEAFRC